MHTKTCLLAGLLVLGPVLGSAQPIPEDHTARLSYSLGYQIGGDFRRQGEAMDPAMVVRGIEDALKDHGQPAMELDEMRRLLAALKQRVSDQIPARAASSPAIVEREAAEFLAANAQREGVVTTDSGLQYRILRAGDGPTPTLEDTVTVHYKGTRMDGREFDNTYREGEPINLRVDEVIPGWQEALQLMQEGAHWELVVPETLAYGDTGPLAHYALVFEVELLAVQGP